MSAFEKTSGPMRIDTGPAGAEATVKMSYRPGGRNAKSMNVMVKVLASSGANVRISADVYHSPDGSVGKLHSTAFEAQDPSTTLPAILSGDADSTKVIGEHTMVALRIKDSAATTIQWAVVEIYEMKKPF